MNYFSVLIKPASSLCNMRCRYCFYADVSSHREVASYGIMKEATAEKLIQNVYAHAPEPSSISFSFQGGEPTLAGLSFFQFFTQKAEELRPEKTTISYSIQTNGQVIDEDWCTLLKKYNFLVGLSQDGPREFHDYNRLDDARKGTFAQTKHTVSLFRRFNIEFNILTVLTKQICKKPRTLFSYYLSQNYSHIQLIPCLKPLDEEASNPYDLTPGLYAEFLKDFFLLWYQALKKGTYLSVRLFDNLVWMLRGHMPEQCGLLGICSSQCVIEADGSVYPCDFYVLDEYCCGSVVTDSFEMILASASMERFLKESPPANENCPDCKVKGICGCGCKRYRSFYNQKKGYCPYQDFLYAVYPYLKEVAEMEM